MANKKPGPRSPEAPQDDETTPADFFHCVRTYRALLGDATSRKDDRENEIIVWEGMLTAFITQRLTYSTPYYTKITRSLKAMGCIRQLRRGGGTAPSQWELITEPTLELWEARIPRKKPTVDRVTMLQGQVNSMNQRIVRLEEALENIIDEEVQS